jgi:hypothetical protein
VRTPFNSLGFLSDTTFQDQQKKYYIFQIHHSISSSLKIWTTNGGGEASPSAIREWPDDTLPAASSGDLYSKGGFLIIRCSSSSIKCSLRMKKMGSFNWI